MSHVLSVLFVGGVSLVYAAWKAYEYFQPQVCSIYVTIRRRLHNGTEFTIVEDTFCITKYPLGSFSKYYFFGTPVTKYQDIITGVLDNRKFSYISNRLKDCDMSIVYKPDKTATYTTTDMNELHPLEGGGILDVFINERVDYGT
jgi:hypothetical protein